MLRLAPLALVLASSSAAQQSPRALSAEALPGAVRHAGIYHVATGTWTRTGGAVARFGPDVVYSNTATSGYFTSAGGAGGFIPGGTVFDEGGLPGTSNGHPFTGGAGPDRDDYLVNGFQIAYCDLGAPASGGWELSFYSSYTPCTVPASNPDGSVVASGLPAGGCWTVTIDLQGTPDEFCLQTDGGPTWPGWSNVPAFDSFGWSYRYAGTDGNAPAGFILAGDPRSTDPSWTPGALPTDGTNTYYGPTSQCPGFGTGYLTQNSFFIFDPNGSSSGCAFFGAYQNLNGCGGPSGVPYGSFWMEIYADSSGCSGPTFGTVYCQSNPNSTGQITGIELSGSDVAAVDDVTLRAFDMPLNSFGFFITSQTQGFTPNAGGSQGNLCVAGTIGRFVASGQIKNSGTAGEITLSTTAGEWSLTAIPTATGPYSAMAGVRSNFQLWHRQPVTGPPASNFSDGITVQWQ